MFNAELRRLLVQVITSWQVLAVTVVLVLYIFLVNYVARLYHKRRPPRERPAEKAQMPEEAAQNEADELGLEEEEAEE